jgi:hypothetical protein
MMIPRWKGVRMHWGNTLTASFTPIDTRVRRLHTNCADLIERCVIAVLQILLVFVEDHGRSPWERVRSDTGRLYRCHVPCKVCCTSAEIAPIPLLSRLPVTTGINASNISLGGSNEESL